MSLILYGVPLSPFYRKAEMVLREKGVEFKAETVNILALPDWFREISPAGRIPVLRDTDVGNEGVPGSIPDSSAICAFIEKKHPKPALYPQDPYELGRATWLEEYADSEMAGTIGMGIFRPIMFPKFAGKEPDLDTARKTWNEKLPKHFDYLESVLSENEFFVGQSLSIADVAIVCQLTNLEVVAGRPDESRWPRLAGFAKRVGGRESIAANLAICRKIAKDPCDLS